MSDFTPTISVIVPIYKVEPYLRRCIDSILAQTFTDFELILVDDGSPDNSGTICDEYALDDSRIITIHKPNGGQATARNYGLDIYRGEYVGFVDSDDYIFPEMYAELIKVNNGNKDVVTMCGREMINEKYECIGDCFCFGLPVKWDKEEAIRRFLTWDGLDGSPWDKLFPRILLGENRFPTKYICEDIPFVFNILSNCKNVIHIGKPMYCWLIRNNSTSHSRALSCKSEGVVIYNKNILNEIKMNYPYLIPEAKYFYLHMALYFHNLMRENKYLGEIYSRNRKGIIEECHDISEIKYFKDYEIRELNRISKWYYPIYKKIKDFIKKQLFPDFQVKLGD